MSFLASASEDLFDLDGERFDFNLRFELVFFSVLPSALFIAAALWRVVTKARTPAVVVAPVFQSVKLVCLMSFTSFVAILRYAGCANVKLL